MSNPTGVPDLFELRRLVIEDAIDRSFRDAELPGPKGNGQARFRAARKELMYAAYLGYEFADPDGPFADDERLKDLTVKTLETNTERFDNGGVSIGDPGAFFLLVSATWSLLSLKPHVENSWCTEIVKRCVDLYDSVRAVSPLTHEYLNARALETVSTLNLHRLTDEQRFLDRCTDCLDNLITRQYPCGAQPYHTGMWIWGRRPAQVYQFLAGSLMLYTGKELDRQDAKECVRRIMDYSLVATNRHGEAFVACFEGLHKARSLACAGRQWAIASALGDSRFENLARTTYEIWAGGPLDFREGPDRDFNMARREGCYLEALTEALHMGVREVPEGGAFIPAPGRYAMDDISAVFVHEDRGDLAMSLLSGYSAFAEADCGNAKLFALTCELTDQPTFANAGLDSLRGDWHVPTEQLECSADDKQTRLSGLVYTKWDGPRDRTFSHLHNRRLHVTMTYSAGELLLEYETTMNRQEQPIPSRLLLLLVARPSSESPRLQIGTEFDANTPSAQSDEEFFATQEVGTVRFSAPDGSTIEIVPELSLADCITAERPPRTTTPRPDKKPSNRQVTSVKPANEGSLRLAFEGPNVLDKGRYRIRFLPADKS